MILGTAGHIDHGKTTLVRALTGVDTDRLPEEKRRGMTIELGFAPLMLDGIGQVGVVDVPGHEAFVRTMVSGAAGVDLALVVVAADAGVMPQTREHIAILSLLGVVHGVVALTKRDLVDAEWIALVEEDVRAALAGTALEGVAIVAVDATTGAGVDQLRRALAIAASAVAPRTSADLFRLPVDRAFSVKGTGTVVTGTVWSGELSRDTNVRLFPSGSVARVRGLEAHGKAVDRVTAGDRAAVALAGVELDHVGRGALLLQGEGWRPSRVLRGEITLQPDMAAVLTPRSRVRLHLGTREVGARLVVRDGALDAGATVSARIVLDDPVVARAGDRFILRSASPPSTLGGGIVTDPVAPTRARPWPLGHVNPAGSLARLLTESGAEGLQLRELPIRLGVPPAEADTIVGNAVAWRVGGRLVGADVRDRLLASATSILDAYHLEHPLEAGAPQQTVRSRLGAPDDVSAAVVATLIEESTVTVEQGILARAGFAPALTAAQRPVATTLANVLDSAGAEPPTVDELAATLELAASVVHELCRWLSRQGALVAVEPHRYYAKAALDSLTARMSAIMSESREYSPSELREAIGLSRKYLIPFLEYCDREGITVRGPQGRRLARV